MSFKMESDNNTSFGLDVYYLDSFPDHFESGIDMSSVNRINADVRQ